ncbi:MAG: PH domain-containing protein [Oscillospiraceae bacterium]|nr:PH domain-containing protein [Oscillospiraceae bacterium]
MILLHGRFHPLSFGRYLKYGLVLCLLPLLNALLQWDIQALFSALWQNLFLMIFISAVSFFIYRASRFTITPQELCIEQGVVLKRTAHLLRSGVTVAELRRTPLQRLLGACEVTLYFKNAYPLKKYRLLLWKKDAGRLADILFPVQDPPSGYTPGGADRLALSLLSANFLTTVFFLFYTFQQFGKIFGSQAWAFALAHFSEFEALVGLFVPAGLSLLASLILLFSFFSLLRALFKTFRFRTQRAGGLLLTSGGLFTHTSRRILLSAVTVTDIRLTPAAFLLRRRPLYLEAGGFRGDDLPFLVCRPGEEAAVKSLLPFFTLPKDVPVQKRRPPVLFFWKPALLTLCLLMLWTLALRAAPALAPPLALALTASLVFIWVSHYAWRHEGFCRNQNRTLSFFFGRRLTFHQVTCYTHDIGFQIQQTSRSAADGLCSLRLSLPSRRKLWARTVPFYLANQLKFIL